MIFFPHIIFNLWYILRKPPWDTGVSPPELMVFIENHARGSALDLGCGTGTNVITLAKHGWAATGVDFAPRAVRMARQKAHTAQVDATFRVDDVTRLDSLNDPYDLILDIGCFHSLPQSGRPAYIQNIKRLLAPNGTYLLYVFFNPANQNKPPGIPEAELNRFSEPLKLVNREDGTNRGTRPAAWLTYVVEN